MYLRPNLFIDQFWFLNQIYFEKHVRTGSTLNWMKPATWKSGRRKKNKITFSELVLIDESTLKYVDEI